MKEDKEKETKWLKSKDAQKLLKVRACDIMHLRTSGKVRFEKKGNAYFYLQDDLDKMKFQ